MSDLQDLIHKTTMDCLERGRREERQRVVKILEDWRNGLLDLHDLPNVVIGVRSIDAMIEYINGETNE
jgi:hypothetical protein